MLLDADIPVFKVASMSQTMEPDWNGGEDVLTVQDEKKARKVLDRLIANLAMQLSCERVVVALSEPKREMNWRRGVLETYKSKRSKQESPVLRQPLTDYLDNEYDSYLKPTLEGDDVLGILATNDKVIKGVKILVSGDKDMQTIPSREQDNGSNLLFNPDKDDEPYWNPEWLADWWWMYQTINGDSTDGYVGLKGQGITGYWKIAGMPRPGNTIDKIWPKVVGLFESKGFSEADAIVQAQVARICRTEDFNYTTREAIPWLPNF